MDIDGKTFLTLFYLAFVPYREARSEPREGKIAVAYAILNRVDRPSWWGDDVPSVATKKWQFSSLTDPRDKQLAVAWPVWEKDLAWQECWEIALGVYNRTLPNPVPGADSYYADYIPAPDWTIDARFVKHIGHHLFYDVDRDFEQVSFRHA